MEEPQCEMEASKRTSERTENTISSSWVLLDSDETSNHTLRGKTEKNIEDTTEGHEHSSYENVGYYTNNNKSDTESDGISIISESEFYNGRSDDDSSINSFDESTSDNSKILERPNIEQSEFQNSLDIPNKRELKLTTLPDRNNITLQTKMSNETPIAIERSPSPLKDNDMAKQVSRVSHENIFSSDDILNVLSSTSDNNDITQPTITMTSFSDPRGSAALAKEIFDKRKTLEKHDMIFAPFNIMCLTGAILFALLAYSIPSRTNQEGASNPDNLRQNCHNIVQYCSIYESSEQIRDYNIEKCLEKLMEGIKNHKRIKHHSIPIGKTFESTYRDDFDSNEVNIAFNEYDNKKKRRHKEKNIEQKYHINNIKLKNNKRSNKTQPKIKRKEILEELHRCNKKIAKNYERKISTKKGNKRFDITNNYIKEKLQKKNLKSWIKKLVEKEQRLIKWEMDLEQREKKLYTRNTVLSHTTPHKLRKENIPHTKKTKPDRSKNQKKSNKNEEFRYKKSFKKNFKNPRSPKFQNGIQNQAKYDIHQIPMKELRNSGDSFIQRRNLSSKEITGEWYINLIKSRSDIRKRNGVANWWFDRVNFRKIKRNKAYWYFQYMFNREDLRYYHKNS
ncbi:histone-lysine N-methyltransferase, H3 lysine-79 specific-like [Coccinella septempunctata]|uniref:histone-lysine N-methyltransferase, H3 lysine-79 specific-like n=1 Tax=Coccinella septempunctata TaxID=41139 RepID=UPI001D05ED0C|nr:histone-lysine N-methyltransferase, H3 lysine-79 specific-like [Coccinella septempunctata]